MIEPIQFPATETDQARIAIHRAAEAGDIEQLKEMSLGLLQGVERLLALVDAMGGNPPDRETRKPRPVKDAAE